MTSHPSQAWIEAYVVGILADEATRELEAHVEGCEPCAERLASEARFELAMELVARGVGRDRAEIVRRPPRLVRRQFGRGAALSGALAMAAVMLLFVGRASSETALEPSVSPAPASMVSLDGDVTVRPLEIIDGG